MIRINIKPLSVNKAWQGRKFKTTEYKKYIDQMMLLLPDLEIPPDPFELNIEFGFSSVASDIDNPLKPLLDILSARYGFNDKMIFRLIINKRIVPKNEDFICFELKQLVN